MSQNPVESTLFVSKIVAGPGISVDKSTGIVTISSTSESSQDSIVAITTVGDGVLTAAGIVAGNIVRSGSTGAFTDTTGTAAAIVAAIPNATVGQSFRLTIKNLTAFAETLAAGSGVTLAGSTVVPGNSTGTFQVTLTSLTAVQIYGLATNANAVLPVVNTAITTVGAGTLTAAAIVGGLISRSGSTAAYSDATDTAVAIVAAIPNASIGQSFFLNVVNTVAFDETITAGVGVTLSGFSVIPANSTGTFLVTLTSLTAVSIRGIRVSGNVPLPPWKFTTAALTAGTIPAASIVGAQTCVWQNTGATPGAQTFPTAATLFAAIPGAFVGMVTAFRVVNTGAGTLTLTADGGATVTITGTATVAQNIFRDYTLTFTSATAATVQSIGSGVSP